jgi:protein-tyrosine phosphatase
MTTQHQGAAMITPSHTDALPGTWNFRDIGGIDTSLGPIRRGIVFRSAALHQLDPRGHDTLESLGVSHIFDLRGEREIARDGVDRVPDSVRVQVAPFHPESDETPVHEALADGTQRTPADWARAYYAAMPVLEPAQQSVAALLRTVADGPGSVLVHCAAGKDRTGWAIGTLLLVSGADRDAVMTDYLLSNAATGSLRAWMVSRYGNDVPLDEAILGVEPSFLEAGWESVDRNFGSFDGYLDAIGIGEDVVDRIRRRLLDEPAASFEAHITTD